MMLRIGRSNGFTLVELLVAVAVIAVGMVFVLGAFSQCMSSLTTAERMVIANDLLNAKIWEDNLALKANNGSETGEWSEGFPAPDTGFRWTHVVGDVAADFGNETLVVQGTLNQDLWKISWTQGKIAKDVSVTRYVKKKKKE